MQCLSSKSFEFALQMSVIGINHNISWFFPAFRARQNLNQISFFFHLSDLSELSIPISFIRGFAGNLWKQVPYVRHYKLQLVYFFTPFLLRFISTENAIFCYLKITKPQIREQMSPSWLTVWSWPIWISKVQNLMTNTK